MAVKRCRNIASDRHATTVLVTGPNSGGKTCLLQAIGIAQILGQSGLFARARGASRAGAGAGASLIQGPLPPHPRRRGAIAFARFERLPPGAMVILDELCSGTNPEGEEFAELVEDADATRRRPSSPRTLARRAWKGAIADLRFLQVELGEDERPTYQFAPRTSLAGQAAAVSV
jgi:DNA mismatch repair protein MutS2